MVRSSRRSPVLRNSFLGLAVLTTPLAGQDTLRVTVNTGSGALSGHVTSAITLNPVPFVLVSLDDPRLEFFSGEQGRFSLPALSKGRHRLLLRQLGYQPLEVQLLVGDGAPVPLNLEMQPRALVLPTLVATSCVAADLLEPDVRAVLDAAADNARRLDLMQRKYPYIGRYREVRETYGQDGTLLGRTARQEDLKFWERPTYRPGKAMIEGWAGVPDVAYFSATALLADSFRKTHCFRFGGIDSSDQSARRITLEFEPLVSLKGPDWAGKLTLDHQGILLSSEAELVAKKRHQDWPAEVLCRVEYEAVGGALPMESRLFCRLQMGAPLGTETVEEWRLECQRFTKRVPGAEVGTTGDSTVWTRRACH